MLCCPDGPRGSHFRKVIPSPGGGLRGDINGVLPLRDGRSLSPLLFLALPKCSFTVSIPDERLEGVTVRVVEPPPCNPEVARVAEEAAANPKVCSRCLLLSLFLMPKDGNRATSAFTAREWHPH